MREYSQYGLMLAEKERVRSLSELLRDTAAEVLNEDLIIYDKEAFVPVLYRCGKVDWVEAWKGHLFIAYERQKGKR